MNLNSSVPLFGEKEGNVRSIEIAIALAAASLAAGSVVSASVAAVSIAALTVILAAFRVEAVFFCLVILSSFVFFLQTGLPIHDVSSLARIAAFVGVLVSCSSTKLKQWFFSHKLNYWIAIYGLIALVSAVIFNNTSDASRKALLRLLSCICLYFVIIVWLRREAQIRNVLSVLMLCLLAVEIYAFYQAVVQDYGALYFLLHPPDETTLPWVGRVTSTLGHFNTLAGYVNLLLPFALGASVFPVGARLRVLSRVVLILGIPTLVLTQSRGGLIACAGTFLLAVWFLEPRWKSRVALLLILVSLLGASLLFLNEYTSRIWELDELALSRLAIYAAAWGLFKSSPLIGIGFGNFRELQPHVLGNAVVNMDAHNVYLQLLSETGVLGFIAFLAVVAIALRMAYRHLRYGHSSVEKVVGFGAIAALVSVLSHGLVDALFLQSPEFSAIFWLVIALVFANSRLYSREAPQLSEVSRPPGARLVPESGNQ